MNVSRETLLLIVELWITKKSSLAGAFYLCIT